VITVFNLLIVEDEETTRDGLLTLIDWESIGIRICGAAENGLQALELFQTQRIDIVLTDIYMPVMDGLQLITQIHSKGYSPHCVLLSGYNEFKYAQSAIRLGVSDFLVKPCSPHEIKSIFVGIINRIKEEQLKEDVVKGLQSQLHENLPLVKTQLLHQWIFEPPLLREDRKDQMKKVGMSISFHNIVLIAIRMDQRTLEKRTTHPGDIRLLQFATANVVQETLQHALLQAVEIVKDQDDIIAICNGLPEWTEGKLIDGLNQLMINVKNYIQITVSIGVSDFKTDINLLSEAYMEALEVLKLRFYRGYSNYFFFHNEGISTKSPSHDLVHSLDLLKLEHAISDSLGAGLYAEALNDIEKWLTYFQEQYLQSQAQIQVRTLALLNQWLPFVQHKDVSADRDDSIAYDKLEEQVNRMDTLEELSGFVYRLFQQIVSTLNPEQRPKRKVQQALEIISKQYATPGLTLADVASTLFVSSNYLSTLFKQELGINFLDYIHQFRIDKAKAHLQSGDPKIQTIAREVGYHDEAHFTRTFKKWTGTLPSLYKKEHSNRKNNHLP
jgi:two-component system response regulator YesN